VHHGDEAAPNQGTDDRWPTHFAGTRGSGSTRARRSRRSATTGTERVVTALDRKEE